MTTQAPYEGSPEPLQQAGPARRMFHLLVAAAGWLLFGYWWFLVLGRTGRDQIFWTLGFIGISLAVIVLVTVLWVVHNVRLFRRKPPRLHVGTRPAEMRDGSRTLAPVPRLGETAIVSAAIVRVIVERGTKAYRTGPSSASPS